VSVKILQGDCRDVLRSLPAQSVHCVVTSPPYWGLRDYGVAGQIGLEANYADYVAEMVAVFREVRRVLRDDGTLWLNLGDAYAGSWGAQSRGAAPSDKSTLQGNGHTGGGPKLKNLSAAQIAAHPKGIETGSIKRTPGLKPKDLIGLPWRVAFALQADGWYLRQDIIWSKPNPMPEYLFLLSKNERYYYDAAAIAEPATYDPDDTKMPDGWNTGPGGHGAFRRNGREKGARSGNKERKPASARGVPVDTGGATNGAVAGSIPWEGTTRNKRSVWSVGTHPFPEAHFATFPPALIEPCILAGCPKGGTVLDPFFGAGTTGLVADRLQRDCIGIELNPTYADMAQRRITDDAPLFAAK
jgi:DNA modification methylase